MSVLCEKFKSDKTGEGLRATVPISRGSPIFVEDPIFFVVDRKNRQSYCNACLKKLKLQACSRCLRAFYCSKQCQVSSWSFHKLECQYFQEIQVLGKDFLKDENIYSLLVLLIGSVGLKMLISDGLHKDKNHLRLICDLTTCKSQMFEEDSLIQRFYKAIPKFVPKKFNAPKNYNIGKYIQAFWENSFYITNQEKEKVGKGLYLNSSLFNHACLPNCFWVIEEKKIKFIAKRDIAKGEELTIAYMDVTAACTEDQKVAIKRELGFNCCCESCNMKLHDDLKLKCQDGSTLDHKKRLTLEQECIKLSQVFELVQSGEVSITAGIRLSKEFLLRNGLAESNWYHILVSDILANYYEVQDNFEACLSLRLQALTYIKLFLPDSVKLGSQFLRISRMYAMRRDFVNSQIYLAEAKKCIEFGYEKLKNTENLPGKKHTYRYEQMNFLSELTGFFGMHAEICDNYLKFGSALGFI